MKNSITTKIILDQVYKFLDQDNLTSLIMKKDRELLQKELEKTVEYGLTFGGYIYPYVYENSDELKERYEKYEDVPEDEYYIQIRDAFADNGMKGRGSLDPDNTKSRLDKKKKLFERKGTSVNRDDLFLFAFGLRMDSRIVSELLQKALLQEDFNPKNPKEVIYYWCLRKDHTEEANPYESLKRWLNYYENGITENSHLMKGRPLTENTRTRILSEKMENLHTEYDFRNYLISLKMSEIENKKIKSSKYMYQKYMDELPRMNRTFEERSNLKNEVLSDEKYIHMGIARAVEDILELRKNAFSNFPKNSIPDKKLMENLFDGIEFTEKSVRGRISGDVPVRRKDLLLLSFLIYSYDIHCMEEDNEGIVDDKCWEERFWDYDQVVGFGFEECRMEQGLYIRNPFELFLLTCLFNKDPFEYFLACWEKAVN